MGRSDTTTRYYTRVLLLRVLYTNKVNIIFHPAVYILQALDIQVKA